MAGDDLGGSVRDSPIDRLVRPFEIFAHNKVAGAFVLMAATAVALLWANSPWAEAYHQILTTHARVGIGEFSIDKPLLLWINDGLMAIFFFVVGLEIKREFLAGELSTARQAALPIAAALGGMLAPALIYIAMNAGGPGANGWGVPMATDIAFALGVLLMLGSRVPLALKVFLTALAIIDDIGAIIVIAVFYTDSISLTMLGAAGLLIGLSVLANLGGVRNAVVYFCIGLLVWIAVLKSGVHATVAAVLMAMTIPATTRVDGASFVARVEELLAMLKSTGVPEGGMLTTEQQHLLHGMDRIVDDATAPVQELEHSLVPLVTFVVMPIFALANAGLDLSGDVIGAFSDPICLGIIAGLFIGKQVGVLGFAVLAVKLRLADLPSGVTWRQVHAVAVLSGIGFTMSIFVSGLAFDDAAHAIAKTGILTASVLAAIVGGALLHAAAPRDTSADVG